eukprot:COSAG04_NODE_4881_length_1847_cov_1.683066_2_plen_114_part_00
MWQAKAVSIEHHTDPSFNRLYTHDSTHEGWPVLKSANDKYCYRYTPNDMWFLHDKFTPATDGAKACIVAKEGPLPVDAHTWKVLEGTQWVDRKLVVGLLVRPYPCRFQTSSNK